MTIAPAVWFGVAVVAAESAAPAMRQTTVTETANVVFSKIFDKVTS